MRLAQTKLPDPVLGISAPLPVGLCFEHFGKRLSRLLQLPLMDMQNGSTQLRLLINIRSLLMIPKDPFKAMFGFVPAPAKLRGTSQV